jgi:hypothetical protein
VAEAERESHEPRVVYVPSTKFIAYDLSSNARRMLSSFSKNTGKSHRTASGYAEQG